MSPTIGQDIFGRLLLKKLEMSSETFDMSTDPVYIKNFSIKYPSVKEITVVVASDTITPFLEAYTCFKNLEILTLRLTKPIIDFPTAINLNLQKFRVLKKLTFTAFGFDHVPIYNFRWAYAGFSNANSLEEVIFNNIEIETQDFVDLRDQLKESYNSPQFTYSLDQGNVKMVFE